MQRGNQIVETIAFIIKPRAAFTGNFGQQFRFQHPVAGGIRLCHIGHHFQRIKRPARIAVNQPGDSLAGIIRQHDILPAIATIFIVHRLREHMLNILAGQRFQQIYSRPG